MYAANDNASLATLEHMLTFRRPAGSRSERAFISEFIRPLGDMTTDKAGNLFLRIGDAPVMWSCHTDTVHTRGGRQSLEQHGDKLALSVLGDSNCLGADDTIGVWLMREMILAQRPGLYAFHRAEERGGIGSYYVATREPARLLGIKAAIALDRRGLSSVITHQGWQRCCSDEFAESLAALLPGYELDDGGVFTDTANYTTLIGECSNLSVGYYKEHTADECLDVAHAFKLRDALLKLDTSKLVYSRLPGEHDFDDDWEDDTRAAWEDDAFDRVDQRPNVVKFSDSLARLVEAHPQEVADLLEEFGYDAKGLAQDIWARSRGR